MNPQARHLLVIGAQRCGTTYVRKQLDAHPEITMARPVRPEPKVFCSEEDTARGLDWYRSTWFGHADQERLLGDKSTSYLEDPLAPARAATMLADPLILAVLRDPVERARSNWAFSTQHGRESRPLVEALEQNLAGPEPWDPAASSVSPFAYLERGHYVRYLEPWWDRFGDAVVIAFFEDLVERPDSIGALYAALGVDAAFRPEGLGLPVNSSEAPDALPADLETRLREHFEESDRALAARLGRPLPWRPETKEAP